MREPRLGIIGGGQLSRMLVQAAQALGFEPLVLAAHADEPAAQVSQHAVFGSQADPRVLSHFLSQTDRVLFENEWLPFATFKALGLEMNDAKFCPGLSAMELLQDKLEQKRLLTRLGIKTARFAPCPEFKQEADVDRFLRERRTEWGGEPVLKWAREGYDGKGTWIGGESSDRQLKAFAFLREAAVRGITVYAEERIRFEAEVALIGVMSVTQEWTHYPLVVTRQERGICVETYGPAARFGFAAKGDRDLEAQAAASAKRLALEVGLSGAFAIEFFVGPTGELLANEIAPRVHNSGHFSLNGAETSQFENHIRACLGWQLGPTRTAPFFGMLNVIGAAPPSLVSLGEAHLHWYGKKDVRPGRKMGHFNYQGVTLKEFEKRRESVRKVLHGPASS